MAAQDSTGPAERQNGLERNNSVGASPNGSNGSDPKEINPDLTRQERHQGVRAGDTYVRVVRPHGHLFKKVGPGVLRATEEAIEPSTTSQLALAKFRRVVIGEPLPNAAEITERLTKVKALAIFASDAMSSVAYATEEILLVLALAGTNGGLDYVVPISMAIALLLGVVAFSYRQTVYAYPNGGGSYVVSKENLGLMPGLVAAAALLLDYVLTVAVSIAAGTAAITSAFPELQPHTVAIALAFIALMVIGNLRGVRESGNIFALPTYVFIAALSLMIGVGIWRLINGEPPVDPPSSGPLGNDPVTLWLLLTAFSAGSVAASGTEAIANGVPAFKPPESRNAARTLVVMALVLASFFLGISYLTHQYNIVPIHGETVVSQLARAVFGTNPVYYLIQFATMMILILAANTSFNGFPRLAWILARDGFLPNQFSHRGDRLAFSNGIVILGVLAGALIVLFQGDTHLLIPLYAVGVFLAFTMSQIGMVVHWRKTRSPGWKQSALINGFGAFLTLIALTIAATTKFTRGAWIIIVALPLLVAMFWLIKRHYDQAQSELRLQKGQAATTPLRQIVIVPVAELNRASQRALSFARGISSQVYAVHVTEEPGEARVLAKELRELDPDVKLIVLESPYRAVLEPLLKYIDALHEQDPDAFVTVVVPEFLTAHWWQRFLHNGTAARLNRALKPHPNVAVVNVPYVLEQ
jgi:amino acid transporter